MPLYADNPPFLIGRIRFDSLDYVTGAGCRDYYSRSRFPDSITMQADYFRQVGDISPQEAAYYFRMVDVDFTPRRVYYAVQEMDVPELTAAAPSAPLPVVPVFLLGTSCAIVTWLFVRSVRQQKNRV